MDSLPDEIILHIMSFVSPVERVCTMKNDAILETTVKSVDKHFNDLWTERMRRFSPKLRKKLLVENFGYYQSIQFCLKTRDFAVLDVLKKSECYKNIIDSALLTRSNL